MTITRREQSRSWLEQARSDLRTAQAVKECPSPMEVRDVGCHLALLCAQALEKSIKGYFILCGKSSSNTHRADKFVATLIRTKCGRLENQFKDISALFNTATKGTIRDLVNLTPGTLGANNVPTTEYPWDPGSGGMSTPVGHPAFSNAVHWLADTKRVVDTLEKLRIAETRLSSLK